MQARKYIWWQVPGRDAEWERKTRSDFGDNEFDQEFNLSFSVSSTMLLKARDLKYLKRISKEYVQHDLNGLRKELNDKLTWHPDFDPYSIDYMRDAFVLSLDTAQGLLSKMVVSWTLTTTYLISSSSSLCQKPH